MKPIIHKEYLECQCSSHAHIVVLEYDEEMGLMVSVQLNQWRGFFKRIAEAFRYAFGKPSCGSWDTCMIKPEDIPRIQGWLNHAIIHGSGTDYGIVEKD